jgi:hypothetical protein
MVWLSLWSRLQDSSDLSLVAYVSVIVIFNYWSIAEPRLFSFRSVVQEYSQWSRGEP